MIKLIAAISAAAVVAALTVTIIPSLSSNVEARLLPTKGDRLGLKTYGTACATLAWPHFETTCLRDISSPTHAARPVRIITTDRLPGLR